MSQCAKFTDWNFIVHDQGLTCILFSRAPFSISFGLSIKNDEGEARVKLAGGDDYESCQVGDRIIE